MVVFPVPGGPKNKRFGTSLWGSGIMFDSNFLTEGDRMISSNEAGRYFSIQGMSLCVLCVVVAVAVAAAAAAAECIILYLFGGEGEGTINGYCINPGKQF